ncbi:hypothetical protein C8R41DRAFT_872067 [Lentinula lateritia]|uniref:Uncharacterized protein n=1 Tax=Lentinula lateritia TaxID=40482 RepID=A0ABQ8UX92_9AGAR|nr:hypothetical protein C8R41DRAFT_872067 [Lentinula lateritia]
MDAQPHFTRAQARAAHPEDDDPASRQLSLHQSILGPLQLWLTETQPRLSVMVLPTSPLHLRPPKLSCLSNRLGCFPARMDPVNSDDEWFGVAASALYEPNDAYATSGEEGSGRHIHSRPCSTFSSPGDNDFHHLPPPVELSPSVALEDFVELPARLASTVPVLSGIPPLLQSRNFPTLPGACNQLRRSMSTVEPLVPKEAVLTSLPGGLALMPGLANPLLAQTLELIFVVPLAPFLQSLIMRQLGSTAPPSGRAVTVIAHPMTHTPCILCREISSSVPAAMLNQVNPLVISALQTGWPTFISLNYFSRRMSEVGESSVSAAGETWDVDDASQVKFKTKRLKELSFETISRRDWDSIAKTMPRVLNNYFIPPARFLRSL